MCISLIVTDGDFLTPSFILESVYLVATLVMVVTWDVHYEWVSVGIIAIGLVAFQVVEILFCFDKSSIPRIVENNISSFVVIVIIVIQIITIILYISEIRRIGGKGLYESIKAVRRQNMYATSLEMSKYINVFVSRLMKLNYAAGYVNLYFLVDKIGKKKRDYQSVLLFISVFVYLIQAVLSGGRMQFLRMGLAFIIYILVVYRYQHNNSKSISVAKIVKVAFFLMIVLILFYETRVLVGRTNQVSYSFWEIFSTYFAGGLYLFNEYLKKPIINQGTAVGTLTFKDLFNLLYKYGFREKRIVPQLEFRRIGEIYTNTYTAFRYYYQDYKACGVIVLQMIFSAVYNCIYKSIKQKMCKILIPIYGFMFFGLVMHVVSDQFFSILSFGYIETIMHMLLILFLETKVRVTYKANYLKMCS